MQRIGIGKSLTLALLLLCLAVPSFSQTQRGALTGTVTQERAGLPGVRITVSSPALQGSRTVETDVNGNYNIAALPPGQYQVMFEMEGMQTLTKSATVSLAGTARADADLKLSSVSEAITVTAAAPSVVEASSIETNITAATVENLPIQRTLLSTVTLTPGTNTNGPRNNATTISGASSFDSTFYINGTPVNEVLRGQPLDLFIEDALQETTVLTGGAISAEYGRFTGGVVNAISKSGGNEFSGSLRDSLTNPSWSESTPLGESLLDKLSETYEGTLGGRIIRDRLWFFGAGRYVKASQQNFFTQSTQSYTTATEQKRIEGKLTGQITPKHSLIGSFLNLTADITDRCLSNSCWDPSSLSQQETQPQDLYSLNYNGILTNNLLLEGFWSKSDLKFDGSGAPSGSPRSATPNYDSNTGAVDGSAQFCANCGEEVRKSTTYGIKPTYYLSTASLGTHNIVSGYEHYADSIFSNNHQSGSDFFIYNFQTPTRDANGTVIDIIDPGAALVLWWPILENAKANDLATEGLFVNDKWDFNNRWSFNLGARYDKNNATDSAGKKVADDSKISPRLGLTFDAFGDGRLRMNASYSEFVSKIQAGNIADASSAAGQPSQLYWLYYGPSIALPHDQAVAAFFDWFESTGGTNNRNFLGQGGFLLGGGTNGVGTQIENSLKSPAVKEVSLGVSTQVGRHGFLRADYQDRKWYDFYETVLNLGTGTVFDPLAEAELDRGIVTNGNDLERKYKAFIIQGGYRIGARLNVAGNYTWSELRGNSTAETSGAGPIADTGDTVYPEITGYANHNPVGFLAQDQRDKARLWVTYDLPSRLGNFNVSLLERYDSGTPYSAVNTIDPIAGGVSDPGYLNAANFSNGGINYYFSKRGEFRWDNLTATDLGLNYSLPISRMSLFVQGDLINIFNEDAQLAGNTTIRTAAASPGRGLSAFNPFTDTPIECPQGNTAAQCSALGANWQKGPSFGIATVPGSYQTPRTYRVSLGLKF